MSTKALAEALFSRTRLAVLRELCRPGDPELHLREIARRTGFDSRGITRELRRLEQADILKSRRAGRQLMYAMNPNCTVYPELTMLIAKTVGIADLVREELAPLADRIELAYIYGSVARTLCENSGHYSVLVADVDGEPVGFVAYDVNDESKTGTIQLIAVRPDHQNRGIGTELCRVAAQDMKERDMKLASAETAGDASHAPARRAYEKARYVGLPLVRYFKSLSD